MKCVLGTGLVRLMFSFMLATIVVVFGVIIPQNVVSAAAIGVADNGTTIAVNTGAGLVYTITKSGGDMKSCKLNGTELNGSTKASQVNSGLGSTATATWQTFNLGSQVLITVNDGTLIHYYASKYGDNTIYMATYISTEPSIGSLRYIFRGNGSVLTNVPVESNTRGCTGFEGGPDVFVSSSGTTFSKYYGNDQAKYLTIRGSTGSSVGVFMAYGSRETCINGPFFRDIQFQSSTDSEIYNVMNHAEGQIEPYRMGLYGPYALCFTTGSTPSVPDFTWMSTLGMQGYVASSGRGQVRIVGLSGMDSNYTYTYVFANTTAQYWATASSTGYAQCKGMKPGAYTMTVYKGELAVSTKSVTVTAGQTTILNTQTISSDPSTKTAIWRIGNWDGTPLEFLNGNSIKTMHPSDVRNSAWGTTYTVGTSSASNFPAAQFRSANGTITITFTLTAAQAAAAHNLNIGITTAFISGRPSVKINGYSLTAKSAVTEPDTRTLTVGTYRGNNATFSWTIPASDFVAGTNTMTMTPISGSSDSSTYLSASYSFDCLELLN